MFCSLDLELLVLVLCLSVLLNRPEPRDDGIGIQRNGVRV